MCACGGGRDRDRESKRIGEGACDRIVPVSHTFQTSIQCSLSGRAETEKKKKMEKPELGS